MVKKGQNHLVLHFTTEKVPDPVSEHNLGIALSYAGRQQEAAWANSTALKLRPESPAPQPEKVLPFGEMPEIPSGMGS